MKSTLFTVLLMVSVNSIATCQPPETAVDATTVSDPLKMFEPRQYAADNGDELSYRLLKPADHAPGKYDANKKYPLVIFLHGAGERGDDNTAQLKHCVVEFCKPETRENYPCYVLAPQCPEEQKWVEIDWSSDNPAYPESISRPLELTLQIVDSMLADAAVDKSRVYVTGLSMGGYGTWDALARRPELFAAGLPICGGGNVANAPKFKQIPIWCFHGGADSVVKPEKSREMIEALRAAGGEPRYTEYPGVQHVSWTLTFASAETLQWLFAQKK